MLGKSSFCNLIWKVVKCKNSAISKPHKIRILPTGSLRRCQCSLTALDTAGENHPVDSSSTACAWGCARGTAQSFYSLWPAPAFERQSVQSSCDSNKQHPQTPGRQSCRQGHPREAAHDSYKTLHLVPEERHCSDSLGQVTWIPRLSISSILRSSP